MPKFFKLFKSGKDKKVVESTPRQIGGPILDSSSGKPIKEIYTFGSKLGEGAFSTVVVGTHNQTNEDFAIKVIKKEKLSRDDEVALKDEIGILKELNHGHIIRLYDTFEDMSEYYLVTEMMTGGELFDRIVAKSYYSEKEARDVCKILFSALAYCHSKKVAHRDLKPENLLLVSQDDDLQIKIADFGFAKKVTSDECLLTQCGTPGYVAPEILEGNPYGTKCDDWSMGVIAYIILGGYPPFIEQNQRELFKKIRKGSFEFHEEYWSQISSEAKDMIASLLTVDPKKRLTCVEAIQNSWIMGGDDALSQVDLGKNLGEFKKFNAKRKFRQAVLTLIATNKMTSLGVAFRSNLSS